MIGAGAQAELTVQGLTRLRNLSGVAVVDTNAERAADFALRWSQDGRSTSVTRTAAQAAHVASIVLTATWSRRPVLHASDIRPGHHITALGLDEPGKQELDPALVRRSRLFVDDPQLAGTYGVLSDPTDGRPFTATPVARVLAGRTPPRKSANEVTVYAPVGSPWQDLVVAWMAYRVAERTGVGQRIDLLR